MFTGIIKHLGTVKKVIIKEKNRTFWIESGISGSLSVDQSLSHNGVCLTIEEIDKDMHRVTAIAETLKKTSLSDWKENELINLEECLQINQRLDGHIVQGHVDSVAICINRTQAAGSWEFTFNFPKKFSPLIIEKGSVCINGISLTAFNVKKKSFSVAIIPYTFENTNIKNIFQGTRVNLEFDMVGKYIVRTIYLSNSKKR
jgi:riboflavin synthase